MRKFATRLSKKVARGLLAFTIFVLPFPFMYVVMADVAKHHSDFVLRGVTCILVLMDFAWIAFWFEDWES